METVFWTVLKAATASPDDLRLSLQARRKLHHICARISSKEIDHLDTFEPFSHPSHDYFAPNISLWSCDLSGQYEPLKMRK